MLASLTQLTLIAQPGSRRRDETVVTRDDLDTSPQTCKALPVSYGRVIQNRLFRRNVMSHINAPRLTGSPAKLALLVLGTLTGALCLGSANAQTPYGEVPSVVVKYSEQSLATDRGVSELYRRIVRAAEKVCPQPSFQNLSALARAEECRDQAVARAVRQIDNSQLAALYAAHSKNS
jgi:UrcA family protein